MKIFLSKILLITLTPFAIVQANWQTGIAEADTFSLPNADIYTIITNLLLWLLMIFTILAVISFVVTGIMFFTAGANADNAEKAKKMVVYSVIGIAIGLSGYIIISLIDGVLIGNIY